MVWLRTYVCVASSLPTRTPIGRALTIYCNRTFLNAKLTAFWSSGRTWSYSDTSTQNIMAVTSSKQWIHFLDSERCPISICEFNYTSTKKDRRWTNLKLICLNSKQKSTKVLIICLMHSYNIDNINKAYYIKFVRVIFESEAQMSLELKSMSVSCWNWVF